MICLDHVPTENAEGIPAAEAVMAEVEFDDTEGGLTAEDPEDQDE